MNTTLVILFIVSLNLVYFFFPMVKELFESVNDYFSGRTASDEKLSKKETTYVGGGIVLAIVSIILYYKVLEATVKNIIIPKRPVEEPLNYGIAMIVVSLIVCGTAISIMLFLEKKRNGKGFLIAAIIILLVYLLLKSNYVLP